jgi:hypothetical protein
MKLFRIVRSEYWDEYGQLARTYWTVLEKRKFLWWHYWHTIEYQADYDYTSPINFSSYEDAFKFIKEVLFLDKPYCQFVEIIKDEFTISA